MQALPESTGPNDESYLLQIAIFYGKVLPKQAEIPSSCGKGQGQHVKKKSAVFLRNFFGGLSFYSADCISH
jgi:truncated hemoglobin YjbI